MDCFEALADPVRRALLRQLRAGPGRVVDLSRAHDVSRPAVSRHLRVLGEAGLVSATDRGRERHYRLEPAALSPVADLLTALTARPPFDERTLDGLELEVHRAGRDRRASVQPDDLTHPDPQEDTA